jgi:hypothetical protein
MLSVLTVIIKENKYLIDKAKLELYESFDIDRNALKSNRGRTEVETFFETPISELLNDVYYFEAYETFNTLINEYHNNSEYSTY